VDDFSCGCFLFSCFFPFDILFLYILFSFENESSSNVEQKNPTQKYIPGIIPNDIERPISESHNSLNSDFEICHYISKKEHELRQKCRKVGINFESRTQMKMKMK
jgi:hypothetical protein